jgi:tRNA pseudouridine38-40 synthase
MARAAGHFIGRHDFSVYCEKTEEPSRTVVEVTRFELLPYGDLILFRIGASHFLWKMVRRIVGTLVELGRGNISLDQLKSISAADAARWTAPPSGLFLEYVRYPGDPPPPPLVPAIAFRSTDRSEPRP